jgi:hypothetical protein
MEYSMELNLIANYNHWQCWIKCYPLQIFNPALFQTENIIKFFQMKGILKNMVICKFCETMENGQIKSIIWQSNMEM